MESVHDTLQRVPALSQVNYVVELRGEHYIFIDSKIIIHKTPSKYCLKNCLQHLDEVAKKELSGKIEVIDLVA